MCLSHVDRSRGALDLGALRELQHMRDSHRQPDFPLLEYPTQKQTTERESIVEFMAELCH